MGKITKLGLTPTGKLLALILVIGFSALLAVGIIAILTPHPVYFTCKELRKAGFAHIKSDSMYYQPSMDRNRDGIACN